MKRFLLSALLALFLHIPMTYGQTVFSTPANGAVHTPRTTTVILDLDGPLDTTRAGLVYCYAYGSDRSPNGCREAAFLVLHKDVYQNYHDSLWDDMAVHGTYAIQGGNQVVFTTDNFRHGHTYYAVARNTYTINTTTNDTTLQNPAAISFRIGFAVPKIVAVEGINAGNFDCNDPVAVRFSTSVYDIWAGIDSLIGMALIDAGTVVNSAIVYSETPQAVQYAVNSDSTVVTITPMTTWSVTGILAFVSHLNDVTGDPTDFAVQAVSRNDMFTLSTILQEQDISSVPVFTTDTVVEVRTVRYGDQITVEVPKIVGDYVFQGFSCPAIPALHGEDTSTVNLTFNACATFPQGGVTAYAIYERRPGQFVEVVDTLGSSTTVFYNSIAMGAGTYFLANDAYASSSLLLSPNVPNGYIFNNWVATRPLYNNSTERLLRIDNYDVLTPYWRIRPGFAVDPTEPPNPPCDAPYQVCVKTELQVYTYRFNDGLTINDLIDVVEIDDLELDCQFYAEPGQSKVMVRLKPQYAGCFYIQFVSYTGGYRSNTVNEPSEHEFYVNVGPPYCIQEVYVVVARRTKYLEVELYDTEETSFPSDYKLRLHPSPLPAPYFEPTYGWFQYHWRDINAYRIAHRVAYYCNQIIDILPRYLDGNEQKPANGTTFLQWTCPGIPPTTYWCPALPLKRSIRDHVMDVDYTAASGKRLRNEVRRDFVLEQVGISTNPANRTSTNQWLQTPLTDQPDNNPTVLLNNSSMASGTVVLRLRFSKPVDPTTFSTLANPAGSSIFALDQTDRISGCDAMNSVKLTYKPDNTLGNYTMEEGGRVVKWAIMTDRTEGGLSVTKRVPKLMNLGLRVTQQLKSTAGAMLAIPCKIAFNTELPALSILLSELETTTGESATLGPVIIHAGVTNENGVNPSIDHPPI